MLGPFLGRRRLQPFFEVLHEVAMAGLNMGEGASPFSSGEMMAIRYVRNRLANTATPLVVFDVGANIGQFAQVLLREFDNNSVPVEHWLFEPSPATFRKLRTNLNGRRNLRFENIGFGDQPGVMQLYSLGEGSKLASLYRREIDHKNEKMDHVETVTITTVDCFCAERQIPRVNFLKMDVEGHELKVLRGASRMLEQGAIDFIQFEFSGANVDSRTFFKDFYLLLKHDYRLYRVLQDGIWPIANYSESLEIFKRATNYLAERKTVIA